MTHPRHLLTRYGLVAQKGLGQNFLTDEGILQRIAQAADLQTTDTVLEIGPGLGSLTRHLASMAGRVVAVELDDRLLPVLKSELDEFTNIEWVVGNILDQEPAVLCGMPFKVVANVPYYITAPIIRHLLEPSDRKSRPLLVVLTIQEEVAQRLMAGPGAMSVFAVSVQYYAQISRVARIKAGAFFPRPKVDSAVIRLDVYDRPPIQVPDQEQFFRIVRAGFSQKRKQLHNSLRGGLGLTAMEVKNVLEQAEIDSRRRAETLSIQEWSDIAWAMH